MTPQLPLGERFKSSGIALALQETADIGRPVDMNSARDLVDVIFRIITDEIAAGGRVEIRGFGAFFVKPLGAAKKFDPIKKTCTSRDASFRVRFKPSAKTITALESTGR